MKRSDQLLLAQYSTNLGKRKFCEIIQKEISRVVPGSKFCYKVWGRYMAGTRTPSAETVYAILAATNEFNSKGGG